MVAIGTYLIQKNFKGDLIGGLFGQNSAESIDAAKSKQQSLKEEYDKAQKAYDLNHTKENKKYLDKTKNDYEAYNNSNIGKSIQEYDTLGDKLTSLKDKQKSLTDEIANNQKYAEYQASRMAAGYEDAADKIDVANLKTEDLTNQLSQVDKEIIKTEGELANVEKQIKATDAASTSSWARFKAGAQSAWTSIKKVGLEMAKSLAWSMALSAAMESLTTIGGWLVDLGKWIWGAVTPESAEELQEKLEDTKNELSEVESELSSLQSKLDSTNDRIEELQSQGTLTFVEQEELAKLQATTKELESQIALQETLQKSLQTQANSDAVAATDAYLNTSFMSDQTRTEKQEEWSETGEEIGKAVGTVGGAILGAKFLGSISSIGGPLGTAIGMAAGSIIGGLIVSFTGEALAGAAYDSEETVGEAMDNMLETRKQLKQDRDEALANKDAEAYNEATEALRTYDSQMAKHIQQIQANYNAMDWDSMDKDDPNRKKMIEYADWLDKYNISMGTEGAKSNAIARMFGVEADEDIQELRDEIQTALMAGEDIDLREIFDTRLPEEFKERLDDMGISITNLKYYFLDWKKAEEEALQPDFYQVAQEISNVTDGIESLKEAFKEMREQGHLSGKTLESLADTFKDCGTAWTDYCKLVVSGTATTEEMSEATQKLAETFIDKKLSNGPATMEEMMSYITLLRGLGVENAAEYMFSRNEKSAWEKVGDMNLLKLTEEEAMNSAQVIFDEYGITVENEELKENLRLLREKQKQEKSLQDQIDKKQKKIDLVTELEDESDRLEIEIVKLKKAIGDFNPSDYHYDAYTQTFMTSDGKNVLFADQYSALEQNYKKLQSLHGRLAAVNVNLAALPDSEELQADKDKLEAELKALVESMGIEWTAEVQMQLELVNKSELVDEIQSLYDSLLDIGKEFDKNGYLTVDSLQTIMTLEPQYLQLLFNEQGQLEVNRDAILNVAKARLYDLTQKQISTYLNAVLLAAEQGEIDKLDSLTTSLEDTTEAREEFNTSQMQSIANALMLQGFSEAEIKSYMSSVGGIVNGLIDAYIKTTGELENAMSPSRITEAAEEELDRITKFYERRIANLDNQQTYIQNVIDKMQAENELDPLNTSAVPHQYYEQQMAAEESKLELLTKEREELQAQLGQTTAGTDQWWDIASSLWDVEHAIQESTLRTIEFRKSIADLYKEAFDGIDSAYGDKNDLVSDRQNYLEKYMELQDLKGGSKSSSITMALINEEQTNLTDAKAKVADLKYALSEAMEHGEIKEGSQAWVEMQDKIRDAEAAVLDSEIALENYIEKLKELSVEAFNLVRGAFNNRDDFYTGQQDYIQGYVDYLEAMGIGVPEEVYRELIAIEEKKRENNLADLAAGNEDIKNIEAALLKDAEAEGLTLNTEEEKLAYFATDEEWVNAHSDLREIEKDIQDNDIAIAQWNKDIRDMDFETFDTFISRLERINGELSNIYDLVSDEDVAFEDGTWTKEGITSLAMLYQQMEYAKSMSESYAIQIEELNRMRDEGTIGEKEYTERLETLQDGQWSAIKSYEDMKDSIIDLNSARIDMIEEGLQKEAEAYQELIDLKRKELDAERDLYDFKKQSEEQTKNIASLQRRIASLSGSTDAADVAERRRLLAELEDAERDYQDSLYSHSKDSQSKALDEEMEAYNKANEDYIEQLRDKLDDADAIIAETMQQVLANADVVLGALNEISDKHGVTLSSNVTDPWVKGKDAATEFKEQVVGDLAALTGEDGVVIPFGTTLQTTFETAFGAGSTACNGFKTIVDTNIGAIKQIVEDAATPMEGDLEQPWKTMSGEESSMNTFDDKVDKALGDAEQKAKDRAADMTDILKSPYDALMGEDGKLATFSKAVVDTHDAIVKDARSAVAELNAEYAKVECPSYTTGSDSSGGGDGGGIPTHELPKTTIENVKALQRVLIGVWGKKLKIDGLYGPATKQAVKEVQQITGTSVNGNYDEKTRTQMIHAIDRFISLSTKEGETRSADNYKRYKSMLPTPMYAKGTMGTTSSHWAITDEPQYGDELVLIPTKEGNLSYMRKGTSVIPADITENLVKWGQMNPDMSQMTDGVHGVNVMTNVVNKPTVDIAFDSLLHIDNCTNDSIGAVKKLVNEQLENFARKLNYNLKKVGAT